MTLECSHRVFYKHRNNKFFPTSTYVISMTVCQIPIQLLEAAIFSCIMYFWVGFYASVSRFFTFYLMIVQIMLTMGCIARCAEIWGRPNRAGCTKC